MWHVCERGAYKILMGKSEKMRPLGRPKCRWEDNIKINLQETKWGLVDWIHLAQDKETWRSFVNIVINIQVPYIANNILILWGTLSFFRTALHQTDIYMHTMKKCSRISKNFVAPSILPWWWFLIKVGNGSSNLKVKKIQPSMCSDCSVVVFRKWKLKAYIAVN